MDDLINKKKEAVYDEFLAKCCHVFDPEKSNRATYVTDLYVAFTEWRKVENKENPKITPGQFKKYMAQRFPLAGGVNKYFKGVRLKLKGRCLKIIICLLLALLCAGCGDPDVTETEAIPEIEEPKLTIHNDTKFDLDVFYTPSEGVEVTATIMSGGSFEVEEDVEELTIIEGSF